MHNITPELLGKYAARITPLPFISMKQSLVGKISTCINQCGDFIKPLLVADENTYQALGKTISLEFNLPQPQQYILTGDVHAHIEHAKDIASKAAGHDLIIAVGSGTINDLCKYAAHILHIPYVVFPTAPSMNGYVSPTSSLISDGLKSSVTSQSPIGVFCDLAILSNAPYRLIRSGIGDTLCRSTVQADWLLSHLLLDTAYDEAPFELLILYENILLQNAALLLKRDIGSIETLMKALLIGGFGMAMCSGSYPASQGEHIIAHALEKLYPEQMNQSFHGEHIAVTSLYMEKLQRQILTSYLAPDYPFKDTVQWNLIKQKITAVMHPEGLLEASMKKANLPLSLQDIHISDSQFAQAIHIAPTLRNRFGFLNLKG